MAWSSPFVELAGTLGPWAFAALLGFLGLGKLAVLVWRFLLVRRVLESAPVRQGKDVRVRVPGLRPFEIEVTSAGQPREPDTP
ncbi:hypothetical protein [Amycolatopsis anabasis]|uniref:hypothetical protein n=1 Tax=Amycolatopsis anabasis TaxID=1840409 RepID=UPI00131C74AE|nr:hypothetical protein [Amycolatopsis anabasis]